MVPNGWHSILKLNHNKRTDAQHSAGVGFDYSCFLNRLPDIQFLCSEHNKEKNISIFFLYASPHSKRYSFISKVPLPPLGYMLYKEKPQG